MWTDNLGIRPFILTVDNQCFNVLLGFIKVVLDRFLILFPKHLRPFAVTQELSVVSLQSLDDTAVLIWTHLRQLRGNGERSG